MERVRKSIRLLLTCTLTYSCLFWLAIMLIPQVFVGIFTSDPELTETAVWAARIFLFGVFSFGAQVGFQQTSLALGQAKASQLLALLRKIVLLIPLIYHIPPFSLATSCSASLRRNRWRTLLAAATHHSDVPAVGQEEPGGQKKPPQRLL